MPEEGKENMPQNPEVPQGESAKETPVSQWSFQQMLRSEKELGRKRQKMEKEGQEEGVSALEVRLHEIDQRKKELVEKVREEGGLDDIDSTLALLNEMLKHGELEREHLLGQRSDARAHTIEDREENPKSPMVGVREWYHLEGLRRLEETLQGKPSGVSAESGVGRLAEAVVALAEQVAAGEKVSSAMLAAQQDQTREMISLLRGGGYDSLVGTEDAQAPVSVEAFETNPPAWYRELDYEWQRIIRNRIIISMGCFVKRISGHINLDAVAGNERMRIETEALDLMWKKMPEFRIALVTMLDKFFEVREEIPPGLPRKEKNKVYLLVLKDEARQEEDEKKGIPAGALTKLEGYKRQLVKDLTEYFKENPDVLKTEEEGPQLTPEVAARAGVAAAWNLIYISNAIDSGDQGDLRKLNLVQVDETKDPTVGRKVGNSIAFAEQVRAMMLPFDKARGKVAKGRVGTEETWLGDLGDYIAERNRHDPKFQMEFAKRKRRLVPQRLFASLFDMFTFGEEDEEEERPKKKEKISLGRKLLQSKHKVLVKDRQGETSLIDFQNPDEIEFAKLGRDELWGEYADRWDSAKKIYEMLGGKTPIIDRAGGIRPWRQTLATALQKMRTGRSPLAPYFSDPELLIGCLGGTVGLTEFTSEYLLQLGEDAYDVIITAALDDDRLFQGMEKVSRDYVLSKLHAKDMHSFKGGFFESMLPTDRIRIRNSASLEAKRRRAK